MANRIFKGIGIGIAVLLGILILVVVGVNFYLKTDSAQNMIKTRLNESIPGTAFWDRLDIALFRGRVALQDARINGPDGQTVITADRLVVNIGLTGLLQKQIVIEDALFKDPRIHAVMDENGNLNVAEAFVKPSPEKQPPPEKTAFPFGIRADHLEVTNGVILFEKAPQTPEGRPESLLLKDLDITVNNADLTDRSGRLALSVGGGKIDMAGIDTDLRKLTLDAGLENGTLKPLDLVFNTSGPNLSLTGSVADLFETPRPDVKADLAGNLAFIRDMFGLDIPLSGPIALTAKASGALDNPTVQLTAKYGGGELPGIEVDAIALKARMEDQLVHIDHLAVDAAPGRLTGQGEINLKKAFSKGLMGGAFEVNAMAYDLAVATKDLALARLPWTGDLLGGKVSGNIGLAGTGVTPKAVKAQASIDLTGRQIAVKDILTPTDLTLSADADMADSNVAIHPIALNTGGSNLQVAGDYRLYKNTMDLKLDLTSPDLAQVTAPLGISVTSGQTQLNASANGPVMQPAVTAKLTSDRLSYEEITVGNLLLDSQMSPAGKVTVDKLQVVNAGSVIVAKGTLDLFNGSFAKLNKAMPADLDATLKNVEISDFTASVPVKGVIDGTAHLTDTILNPKADLDIKAKDLVYQDTTYGNLTAQLALSNGKLKIKQISLEKGQSKLGISGLLENMDYTPSRPEPLMWRLPAPQYPPGTIVPIAAIQYVEYVEQTGGDVPSSTQNSGMLSFEQPKLDLTFQDSVVHAEDFTDMASGKLTLNGYIRGPIKDISKVTAELKITGSNLSAQGRQIGSLSADIRLKNGTVRLNPVEITNGKSNLTVTGTVDPFQQEGFQLKAAPGFDLDIHGDPILLGDFIDTLSGRMRINGHVGGTLNDLDGRITLSGQNIDTGVQKIESLRVDARLDGQKIFLDPAVVTLAADNRVRAEGWVSLEQAYQIDVTSDPIDLRRIGILREREITGGTLLLNLSGAGTFSDPELKGEIKISEMAYGGKTAPDFDIRLALADQVARVNADLGFPLQARYNLDSQNFSVDSKFSATDLDPYFQIAGMKGFSGQITGSLEASGNAAAPENATARLDLRNLNVQENGTQLLQTDALAARFENGRYYISESRIALLTDGYVEIGGNGNLSGNLAFHMNGSIPMKVLPAFSKSIPEASGSIALQADVGGSVAQPKIDGVIDFETIGMTLPMLNQKLHDLSGEIRISEQAVTIDNLNGKLDTGRFALDGKLALEELQPGKIRLNLTAQSLPIQIPDMLNLEINSDLTLEGTPADSLLAGSITILDGLYYKDVNLNLLERVGEIGRRKRQVQPGAEMPSIDAPFAKNLKFNVAINYRNPIAVDNNLALLQLEPELRISGTMNQPELSGRAEISEGTITFRNTEFTVEKGVIDFVNPYRIEPTLDIEAQSQVRQWRITLSISGNPDNLNFQLSSNPPEADADIISLLLIGKTTAELDQNAGGGAAQAPEQMLANVVANRLSKDIGETTGLDIQFQYKPGQTGQAPTSITPETGPGAQTGQVPGVNPGASVTPGTETQTEDTIQVTVGKELSRRLSVLYGVQRKSGLIVQQSTAIYKLLENLSVSAYQDTEGTFGGELQYRLEWR